ncbi:hypothetical protein DAI21_10075 [Lelliottia sp. WB101]|uniref:YfaZ family outer membrane protein n=1 Tax=Lelliottia sp. WB101 TaxID=2153385 RepID=UPI000D203250|nr:hypothetical protein DAI21_10075 [Lelliottia sp. WB101]
MPQSPTHPSRYLFLPQLFPDELRHRVKFYYEADTGLSCMPFTLIKLNACYRYIVIDGTAENPNKNINNGAYLLATIDLQLNISSC